MFKFKHFISAIIVMLVGICATVSILIYTILNVDNELKRFIIPFENEVYLNTTGKYTLFHEYKTSINNTYHYSDESSLIDSEISVINKNTGNKVNVYSSSMTSSYSINNSEGVSIMSFEISDPGEYIIDVKSSKVNENNPLVLTISDGSFAKNLILGILGTIVTGGITTAATIILVVIGILKGKKQTQSEKQND